VAFAALPDFQTTFAPESLGISVLDKEPHWLTSALERGLTGLGYLCRNHFTDNHPNFYNMAFFEDLLKGYTIVSEEMVEVMGDYSKNIPPPPKNRGKGKGKGKRFATTGMILCI
jgi:hypothetical protein